MADRTEPTPTSPHVMSISTGAMVLRSVSVFLAQGRAASAVGVAQLGQDRQRGKKGDMTPVCKVPSKVVEYLRRKTHFTKPEIEGIHQMYRKLLSGSNPGLVISPTAGITKTAPKSEGLDQATFRDILYNTFDLITEEVLIDKMFTIWDKNSDGAIKFEAFVCGLSIILKGTLSEKIQYCFSIYDLNSDGYLSKDEMFTLLKNSMVKQPGDEDPDEGVRDLVELVLKKFDQDKDGTVSFQDYCRTVSKDSMLLESFGQCLPHLTECLSFLESLTT